MPNEIAEHQETKIDQSVSEQPAQIESWLDQEPEVQINAQEDEKTDYLSQVAKADWAFKGIEPDGGTKHCLYKRRNFFVFINAPNHNEINDLLKNELETINKDLDRENSFISVGIVEYIERYEKKIEEARERIKDEQTKLTGITEERKQLQKEKEILETRNLEIMESSSKILHEIAEAKKDILGKWLTEAKEKIDQVLSMAGETTKGRQTTFNNIYTENKEQHKDLEDQFTRLRKATNEQLEGVDQKLKQLSTEGITIRSSKILYRFGFAAAIAAGWLFSIFVSKAGLSNSDIISYLFNGLGKMAHNMPGNGYERIWQWAGILAIVSLVTLAFRSLLVHTKRNSKTPKTDTEYNDLFFRVSNDSFTYTSKTKATGWSFFWFRIGPRLFALGVLLIFLSFYTGYDSRFSELNTALFGLMVGSALALGMGGIIYLYILKVIEPRNRREHPTWFNGQFELLLTIVVFLGSLITLCILPAPKDTRDPGFYTAISISLFLSASLISGFLIGYGIRHESLIRLKGELEEKIYEYNGNILRYAGPQKAYIPREFHDQVNAILQGILKKIEDRNNAILRRKSTPPKFPKFPKLFRRKPGGIAEADKEDEGKSFLNWVYNFYLWIKGILREAILPSENVRMGQRNFQNNQQNITELDNNWDKDFFPDLTSRIDAFQKDLEENTKLIDALDTRINNLGDKRYNPLARSHYEIYLWTSRISNWSVEITKASLSLQKGKAVLNYKHSIAVKQVQEAYQLAVLYLQNRFNAAIPNV